MSKKELERVEVLARVQSEDLRLVDGSQLMRVSYRQAKRLWRRYRENGASGLKHRSAGRPSNHAYKEAFRQKVLGLVRTKYSGPVGERFGPTLAAEHLASEDRLTIDAETLRRWMLADGLWNRERKHRVHRRRRERKEHFGEMVQLDGSFHAWLEDRGPGGCIIDLIDDATNTTWAQLGDQETIWAVADALRKWIERYGVPLALYVDWKNLYKRPATPKEQLRGEEPVTQFGCMCAKLGIKVIAANSPQAKGRVERLHGTHQDRLVKKMRRKKIDNHQQANVYLETEYLPEHNRRFARVAARPEDYHRRMPRKVELDRIFCLESERTIYNDWVVRYNNRFFQIERQSRHYAPARGKVLVCEGRNGTVVIEYRGNALSWKEIPAPSKPVSESKPSAKPAVLPKSKSMKKAWVPAVDHPWRQAACRGARRRAKKLAAIVAPPLLAQPSASP